MAIKSKSRSKKGKHVARAPRPTPVEVKPPFFLRKRVQVALALLAGIGLAALVVWITNGLRAERDEDRARRADQDARQAVSQYQAAVDGALKPVGRSVAPGAFDAFPQLSAAIVDLSKGKGSPERAGEVGRGVADAASASSKAIGEVDVEALVKDKDLDVALVVRLLNSKRRFIQALDLYQQVGKLLERASAAPAGEREGLIVSAADFLDVATAVFADAYGDYSEALKATGLFAPNPLGQFPPIGQG